MGLRSDEGTTNPTAQEVLAYEFRQGGVAEMALPGRRRHRFGRSRLGHHFSRREHRRGSVTRHFVPLAVTTLTFGVRTAPAMAGLVTLARGA